jgi:peptidoglycan/LPS O-acetylase OafA/YrhL
MPKHRRLRQGVPWYRRPTKKLVGAISPAGTPGASSQSATTRRGSGLGYMPALDGVRAVAVLAVMAYHGGISFMPGGFFGVDAFFVLSGFLITSLLVTERFTAGRIALRAFWARRARRLLPALLVVVIAVVLYARFVAAPGSYPDLRIDAFSTLFYVANWHFIVAGQNYFVATGPTSPLLPTWSLAIEEQFYIVWPLLLVLILRPGRGEARSLRLLLYVSLAGAAASALEMAFLYQPADASRVYFGSDTHAQCLLVGAALAAAVALWRRSAQSEHVVSRGARWALGAGALFGVGVCAWAWSHLQFDQSIVFEGGFAIVSFAVAAVLLCVVLDPRSVFARLLSLAPLRYLGRISYGVYLWHFPLDIALTESRVGIGGYPLFLVRSATAIGVATVSYYALEQPIRTGTFFTDIRARIATPLAVGATAVAVVVATSAPAVAAAPAHPTPPRVAPSSAGKKSGKGDEPGTVQTAASDYSNDPVRVMVVGDSVALTLAVGLYHAEDEYHMQIYDQGIIGCGVAIGNDYEYHGAVTQIGAPCNVDPSKRECFVLGRHTEPCQSWESAWKQWLQQLHPNVVVLLAGRWEVVNRTTPSGAWTNILNPSYAQYVKGQLEQAVQIATSTGAKMVLETSPCFDSGEQPDGAPWPEDSPARLDVYNDLVRQVAAENPTTVTLQDLDAVVCPGGNYTADLNGVPIRSPDGVHFVEPPPYKTSSVVGGYYLAPSLLPLWEQLGHDQEAISHGTTVPHGSYDPYFLAVQ